MKSNMKKRIIAVMLCMAMLASYGSYALAEGEAGAAQESSQALTGTGQTAEKAEAAALAETPAVQTETAEAETPAVQEQTPAQESAPAAADTQTDQTQTPAAADTQAAQTQTPAAEPQTPAAQTQATVPEVKHQDALELKQEVKDADGTVLCTVTANIEEGTFDANTEEVSMKVSTIDQTLTDEITDLAKKKLASDKELGSMFLYKVEFQVNGTTAEPGKEVKLTFQPKDFQIDDTKKATVFYYNEANSQAGNTEAEIVEIIQKQEQIEALQAAGQSTDTVDEDYDLTEISLKEDGTADKIVTEGRRSTVYGCYLEEQKPEEVKEEPATSEEVLNPSEEVKTETPKEDNLLTGSKDTAEDETDAAKEGEEETLKSLDFENEKVTVTVTEVEAGAIPEGAKLKVVPILEDDEDTADQYKEVEEQIQKKAEEDEKEIEGFLAYDITFVDKDGNEMEPNSEVKVTMEYKKPAIPTLKTTLEIQDKEVSVLHLEEDEDGNVAQVVDMNEAGQLDEIKTGDYQQVEKVEMRTESFSTFTLYWWYSYNSYYNRSIDIHVVSENGQGIENYNHSWKKNSFDEISVEAVAAKINVQSGYVFTEARTGSNNFADATTKISSLRYNDNTNRTQYQNEKDEWIDVDTTVFFVFKQETQLDDIPTVNSKQAGITLNLFDYDPDLINQGKDFKFTDGSSQNNTDVNRYHSGTGSVAVFDGIFKNNMASQEGEYTYPQFSNSYNGGKTAEYLFSTDAVSGKSVYADVNNLFTKDSDGYYEYDSSKNYAYYNKTGENEGKFTVYNVPAAPAAEDADCYMIGNFFPFNTLAANSSWKSNGSLRNFESGTNFTTKNTHFGMTMSATFIQPKEGKINDKEMIFDFTGDDDVWVFIDGVLVLDIGGIHDALSGKIDFNSGKVMVTGQPETTLKALFEKAERDTTSGFSGDTFSDYTEHTINFYYLERGEGASNCRLRFNIQTIPEGDVIVEKQLGITGTGLDNVEFKFKAETSTDNSTWNVLTKGTEYKITSSDGSEIENGTVGDDGSFTLKSGQRAVFKNIDAGTYFRTQEISTGNYSTSVTVSGTDTSSGNNIGRLTVSDGVNYVLFVNTPDDSSLLNYDKNVVGADCDNRAYEVNLSASTLGSTSGAAGNDASIVLLLDASDSLSDTDFEKVKTAAGSFLSTAKSKVEAENSGDIKIAVVWYQGVQGSSGNWYPDDPAKITSSGFYDVATEFDSLDSFINSAPNPDGGTPMGLALEKAEDLLNGTSDSQKYVLLFTDGLPGNIESEESKYVCFNCMVANDSRNHADSMKNKGVTIYTVGYGDDLDKSFYWYPGDSDSSRNDKNHKCDDKSYGGNYPYRKAISGTTFLSKYIASDGCAIITYSADDLSSIFEGIAGSMGSNLTTATEKIMDVVDSRFNLLVPANDSDDVVWTDKSGEKYRIAVNGDEVIDNNGNVGNVSYDSVNEEYTITWSNVVIQNINDGGWGASFYIKAKEDFVGGNMVPTNGESSGIYLPDKTLKFPMPTVNVKLLNIISEDKTATYFKGETVDSSSFIDELLNTAKIQELVMKDGASVTIDVSDLISLTTDQKDQLAQGNEVTVDYKYPNTQDIVGSFKLTYEKQDSDSEKYVLSIKYVAKSVEERENSAWKKPSVCSEVTEVAKDSTYTVSYVSGSITVKKTVSVADLRTVFGDDPNASVTFTFNIKGTDAYEQKYDKTINIVFNKEDLDGIDGGTKEITKQATERAEDLALDNYTVSENPVNGFEAQAVEAQGLSGDVYPTIKHVVNDNNLTATVYVGFSDDDNISYLDCRNGEVTFTNSKVTNKWQIVKVSETNNNLTLPNAEFELIQNNTAVYTGTSNATGVIEWKKSGDTVEKLDKGVYTLKETSAPSGYERSTAEWTIEITASGALKSIESTDNLEMITTVDSETGKVSYLYTNKAVYALPSSGGPGIYWYLFGGVLLMMAASLIVYKNKRREVLKR